MISILKLTEINALPPKEKIQIPLSRKNLLSLLISIKLNGDKQQDIKGTSPCGKFNRDFETFRAAPGGNAGLRYFLDPQNNVDVGIM